MTFSLPLEIVRTVLAFCDRNLSGTAVNAL
jgi:hypothetical protein